jgi:hypothetical protein
VSRQKIILNSTELNELYWGQGLSPYKIADIYGCSFSTITNRLKEYGIALKGNSQARLKYPREPFSDDLEEKSYMLGFRLGDLNCYKTSPDSEAVIVRCHTTDTNQVEVMKELFSKYGGVKVSSNDGHYHVNCYLDRSFDFLVTKKFYPNSVRLYPLTAGYFDAEVTYQINQAKARVKVDSYDYDILKWISKKLQDDGISNKFYRIKHEKALYRLTVNQADKIELLIKRLMPYMLHKKQIKRAKICLQNVEARRKNGTIN